MININIFTEKEDGQLFLFMLDRKRFPESEYHIVENSDEDIVWDLVVVYEGMHRPHTVRCRKGGLVFISGEPPMSRVYATPFLKQFDTLITQHPKLHHPRNIQWHPCMNWHVGIDYSQNFKSIFSFDQLESLPPMEKTRNISMITSALRMMPGHNRRMNFVEALKQRFGDKIDLYGRGIKPIDTKYEALKDYRFAICIENSSIPHYWTEKFADPILSYTVPIYFGCTNINDYFDPRCYISIDINDTEAALAQLQQILDNAEAVYQEHLPYVKEARRKLMAEYCLFPTLMEKFALHLQQQNAPESVTLRPCATYWQHKWLHRKLRLTRLMYKLKLGGGKKYTKNLPEVLPLDAAELGAERKILYVLKHNPWGIGGGCVVCRNYFDAFRKLFPNCIMDVCICQEYLQDCSERPANVNFIAVPPRGVLSKVFGTFSGILHRHQNVATYLLKEKHYDLCIFDHNCMAGSLVRLCKERGTKTIVLNHNCEYEYFRDNNSFLKRIIVLPKVVKCERTSYKECDYNLFLTKEDKALFANRYGYSDTTAVVSGCFWEKDAKPYNVKGNFHTKGMRMVISGSLCNVQNVDGIKYFLQDLYPLLPKDIEVVITGKNPSEALVERLKDYTNVTIIASPKDILSVVGDCDIFLCPARLGGGMKLRIIDGLRCGLPVVTHSVSARGYSEFSDRGMLFSFDTPQQFADRVRQCVAAIKEESLSKYTIVETANELLSFEKGVQRLQQIFK